MTERWVYLSGEWFPESEAKLSIFDSAVCLGDMVTESTRTFNQVPFKLDVHIRRLYKSLKVTRMDPELSPADMMQISLEVMERNLPLYGKGEDLWIVHNISRGLYPPSGDQSFKRRATILIYTLPMDLTYWAEFYVHGCHAVTPFSRMMPAQSLDPKIKNRSRMAYTLAELEVKLVDPKAQGIILDLNGYLAENKGGNFFIVSEGVLYTPRTLHALAGVSRATVLELAEKIGIPAEERDLQPYDVYTADEAFFTSTPYCIMPATRFNGLPVGDGSVGPITRRLLGAWSELVGVDVVQQALNQLNEGERKRLGEEWSALCSDAVAFATLCL